MLRSIPWLAVVAFPLCLVGASPAHAQYLPWFNGAGVSLGGGAIRFQGTSDSPLVPLIRPDGDVGGAAVSAFLSLGTHRWSLLLPEGQAYSGVGSPTPVTGTLVLGSSSLPFESSSRSLEVYAVLLGGQVGLVPSGRVWVRGGIGSGSISSSVGTDEGLTIGLSEDVGLAVSGAAGASLWRRAAGKKPAMSLDAEVHYLRISGDSLRVTIPSARIGWRFFFPFRTP